MIVLVGSCFPHEKSCQIWTGKKLPEIVITSLNSCLGAGSGPGQRYRNRCCQLTRRIGLLYIRLPLVKKCFWAGALILSYFEVACRGQKRQFAVIVLWSFGNTDMNCDQAGDQVIRPLKKKKEKLVSRSTGLWKVRREGIFFFFFKPILEKWGLPTKI